MIAQQKSEIDKPLCEATFDGEVRQIYIRAQISKRSSLEPKQLMPSEPLQHEWYEVHGTLYVGKGAEEGAAATNDMVTLGSLLAWYYPSDQTLTILGFTGIKGLQEGNEFRDFAPDNNIRKVWQGLERTLRQSLPQTMRIRTQASPFPGPAENEMWRSFLKEFGYSFDEYADKWVTQDVHGQ